MSNITSIRPFIKPPSTNSVRLVGAWLRCVGCQFEWKGNLNEWSEVTAEALRCPRCTEHREPPTAA
jgi:hypothetical protein